MVSRCWFEVRKFWLEYITFNTSSVLKHVLHAFWRDEYQEKCGNLPYIHGLVALFKEDIQNPLFKEMIMDLQKCSVLDLCPVKEAEEMIGEGLLADRNDWHTMQEQASRHLSHTCTARCKMRIGPGNGPESFKCEKINTVFACTDNFTHEFAPLRYLFCDEFNTLMKNLELYKPPQIGVVYGKYFHLLLQPT